MRSPTCTMSGRHPVNPLAVEIVNTTTGAARIECSDCGKMIWLSSVAGTVERMYVFPEHIGRSEPEPGRPLVYCPTCRDEHAVGAPHFANRTDEGRR